MNTDEGLIFVCFILIYAMFGILACIICLVKNKEEIDE
jgi:hypothetical protein